ncbi:MAG: hypothetical protein DRP87_04635 [Spirochaetes bacterium]|nr:MAG: hypothetical protein DRP87_04635 [Spirochaetota bacterium]
MKSLNPIEFVKGLQGILNAKVKLPASLSDNPVLQLLIRRRSVRKFQQKDIPDDVFRIILEAARLAPSTVNLQTWKFGIFNQESWQETFEKPIPFKGNRAVIILGDMHRIRRTMDEFPFKPLVEYTLSVINASIAAYAMNIAAEACGVSSVMLSETGKTGFYDAKYLKEKLGLPDGVYPVMTIVFGYARGKMPVMPPKLPLKSIVFSGTSYEEADENILREWLEQMMAGYRASFVTQSFKGKLNHYLKKVDQAERNLSKLIFYREEEFKDKIE